MSEMVVELGVGVGEGDGVGDAVGVGVGEAAGDGDGDGAGSAGAAPGAGVAALAKVAFPPQPMTRIEKIKATLKATTIFTSLILGERLSEWSKHFADSTYIQSRCGNFPALVSWG